MTSWILRLILILFVIRAVVRLVAGVMQGLRAQPSGGTIGAGRSLVRDPVCGTFIVPNKMLSLGDGSARHYFCSTRCRDEYASKKA